MDQYNVLITGNISQMAAQSVSLGAMLNLARLVLKCTYENGHTAHTAVFSIITMSVNRLQLLN